MTTSTASNVSTETDVEAVASTVMEALIADWKTTVWHDRTVNGKYGPGTPKNVFLSMLAGRVCDALQMHSVRPTINSPHGMSSYLTLEIETDQQPWQHALVRRSKSVEVYLTDAHGAERMGGYVTVVVPPWKVTDGAIPLEDALRPTIVSLVEIISTLDAL